MYDYNYKYPLLTATVCIARGSPRSIPQRMQIRRRSGADPAKKSQEIRAGGQAVLCEDLEPGHSAYVPWMESGYKVVPPSDVNVGL